MEYGIAIAIHLYQLNIFKPRMVGRIMVDGVSEFLALLESN